MITRRKGMQALQVPQATEALSMQTDVGAVRPHLLVLPSRPAAANSQELDSSYLLPEEPVAVRRPRFQMLKRLHHSRAYFAAVSFVTILSFVLDDLRVVALPKNADAVVDGLLLLIVALFIADVGLQRLVVTEYVDSVYFWMDLGSSACLFTEVVATMGGAVTECETWYFHRLRICVRSARLCNITIRLVRHLNLTRTAPKIASEPETLHGEINGSPFSPTFNVRFSKASSVLPAIQEQQPKSSMHLSPQVSKEVKRQSTDTPSRNQIEPHGTFNLLCQQHDVKERLQNFPSVDKQPIFESKISKRMIRKLIGMMAAVGVALGLFAWLLTVAEDSGSVHWARYGLLLIDSASAAHRENFFWDYVDYHTDHDRLSELVRLSTKDGLLWQNISTNLRKSERCTLTAGSVEAEFSIYNKLRLFAIFDLCETLLLCALFCFVCLDLSAYFRAMVLFPLERMFETVRLIWKNPLNFMKAAPQPTGTAQSIARRCCERKKDFAEGEIRLLENAFRKIGVMLGIVYGSAGSEMITNSIALDGKFSPVISGKQVLAIFCFAKLGNFEDALESLGPNILSYVNLVSKFVHHMNESYLGSVNKNLSDSYLLVWKFPQEDGMVVDRKLLINPYSSAVRTTTSLALMFAVKTIAKVACNRHLIFYREQIKHARSEPPISFGFHMGWAYEGPIGSAFKIDASYLSPNVNMAARLETAAQQYKVFILVSSEIYTRVADEVRLFLRHIDTVKLRGVSGSVPLYSFDLSEPLVTHSPKPPTKRETQNRRQHLKQALEEGLITIAQMFARSETLATMRRHYPDSFFPLYDFALSQYLSGHWREAYDHLTSACIPLVPFDGPTAVLLRYIESCGFRPPSGWRGVRELLYK